MAAANLEVVITAVDRWSDQFKDMSRSLESHSKALKTAGIAVTGFGVAAVGALAMATKAAADEQAGITRLSQAMANVGVSYKDTQQSLEAYIDAQQQKTSIADNDQRDALGALIAVTSDYNRALSLLPLAMDVAAAKGMDLTMASELVGRVAEGNVTILQRYGVQLREGASATEALGALQQKFAGQAEAYGKTVAGQWALLKNNLGDVAESIGTVLLPAASKLAEIANGIAQGFKNMNPQLQQFIAIGGGVVGGFALISGAVLIFLSQVPKIIAGIKALQSAIVVFKVVAVPELALIVAGITAIIWALKELGALDWIGDLISGTNAAIRAQKEAASLEEWIHNQQVAAYEAYLKKRDETTKKQTLQEAELRGQEILVMLAHNAEVDAIRASNIESMQVAAEKAIEIERSRIMAEAEARGQMAIALAEQDAELERIQAESIQRSQDMAAAADKAAQAAADQRAKTAFANLVQRNKEAYETQKRNDKLAQDAADQRAEDAAREADAIQKTNDKLAEAAQKVIQIIKDGWDSVRESLGFAVQEYKKAGLTIQEVLTGWAAVSGRTIDEIIADLEAQGLAVEDVGKNWDKLGVPLDQIIAHYKKIKASVDAANVSLQQQQDLQRRQLEAAQNPARIGMPRVEVAEMELAALASNAARAGVRDPMPTLDIIMDLAMQLWRQGVVNSVQEAVAQFGRLFNIPGYAQGGVIPGPVGRPSLAVVHGGETITPAGKGGVTIIFQGPVYGLVDFRDKVNQIVRDTVLGGGYRGVLNKA